MEKEGTMFGVLLMAMIVEGNICLNGCSGHGVCEEDYVCLCDPGWAGDDCRHQLVRESLPILSAGHFRLTSKNLTRTIKKVERIFVGYSSENCAKCAGIEVEYMKILNPFRKLKIAFARADAKLMTVETHVPSIVVFLDFGKRTRVYDGPHTASDLIRYAEKLAKGTSWTRLEKIDDGRVWLQQGHGDHRVVGIFDDEIHDDELHDFIDAADDFFLIPGTTFAIYHRREGDDDPGFFSPGVVMNGTTLVRASFPEFTDVSIAAWIHKHALPRLGELTPLTFPRYEHLQKPMAILFLDLPEHGETTGKSGGLWNVDLIKEFDAVAKDDDLANRFVFTYCDGRRYGDRMKSLGLFGKRARLPGIAMNTQDPTITAVYPAELPLDRNLIRSWIIAFLANRIRRPADADAFALQHISDMTPTPHGARLTPHRRPPKPNPSSRPGVYDDFTSDDAVVVLTPENFSDVAINDPTKDVMILFHAIHDCIDCAAMAVYYKKVADRFTDLGIPSLVVARFDATDDVPPLPNAIIDLPSLLFLPAHHKHPPFSFYSGVSKVQPIMRWAQSSAFVPFDLPDLCHLSEDDRILYKLQVSQREKVRLESHLPP